jgi:hypothetical protein
MPKRISANDLGRLISDKLQYLEVPKTSQPQKYFGSMNRRRILKTEMDMTNKFQ